MKGQHNNDNNKAYMKKNETPTKIKAKKKKTEEGFIARDQDQTKQFFFFLKTGNQMTVVCREATMKPNFDLFGMFA